MGRGRITGGENLQPPQEGGENQSARQEVSTPIFDNLIARRFPLLESLKGMFGSTQLKRSYAEQLSEKVSGSLPPSQAAEDAAFVRDEHTAMIKPHLKELLQTLSIDELKQIDHLLTMRYGSEFLTSLLTTKVTPGKVEGFRDTFRTFLRNLAKHPENVCAAIEQTQHLQGLMANRLTVEKQVDCILTLSSHGVGAMAHFLAETKALLNSDHIYLYGEEPTERAISAYDIVYREFEAFPLLQNICKQIIDMSCLLNTQVLQYCVGCITQDPMKNPRYLTKLEHRDNTPLSTMQEFIATQDIYHDGENVIKLPLLVTLRLTDPVTFATHIIQLPLPLKGELTQTEVRKQLNLLEAYIKDPDTSVPEPFQRFAEQLTQELGHGLRTFYKGTCSHPRFPTVVSVNGITPFGPIKVGEGSVKGAFKPMGPNVQMILVYEDENGSSLYTTYLNSERASQELREGRLARDIALLKEQHERKAT